MRKVLACLMIGIFLLINSANIISAVECQADTVHLVDKSDGISYSDLSSLKLAVINFIDSFNPAYNLMGLVTFEQTGHVDVSLTNNFNLVKSVLNNINYLGGYANIGDGIGNAYGDFLNLRSVDPSRNPVQDYIILTTSGVPTHYIDSNGVPQICPYPRLFPTACTDYAIDMADIAKYDGVKIYVVGVNVRGLKVRQFLGDLSSGPGYTFIANDPVDLDPIYQQIADEICDEEGGDANLEIWDDSDNEDIYVDEDIIFYADYTDAVSGLPISTGTCAISFDLGQGYGASTNMVYNSLSKLFTYETSFPDEGVYDFKVVCSDVSYETLEDEDEFEILEECDDEPDGDSDYVNLDFGCVSEWECGDWSSCRNGMKSRDCVDLNKCELVYNEPLKSVGCNMPVDEEVLVEEVEFNWLFWILLCVGVLLVILLIWLLVRR